MFSWTNKYFNFHCKFQDVISQFENTYRRGGGAAGARVRAERKLAILDKVCLYFIMLVALK
jgi:hypothetical protein